MLSNASSALDAHLLPSVSTGGDGGELRPHGHGELAAQQQAQQPRTIVRSAPLPPPQTIIQRIPPIAGVHPPLHAAHHLMQQQQQPSSSSAAAAAAPTAIAVGASRHATAAQTLQPRLLARHAAAHTRAARLPKSKSYQRRRHALPHRLEELRRSLDLTKYIEQLQNVINQPIK